MNNLNITDIKKLKKLQKTLSKIINFKYSESDKITYSLYRYGYFKINNYVYYISGWNNKTQVVTFYCDEANFKFKFDIINLQINNTLPTKSYWQIFIKYINNIVNAIKGDN